MKINVNGREVKVKDKLAELYNKAAGKLDSAAIDILLTADGIDPSKLSDKELEKQVNKSIEDELKAREKLSNPDMVKAAKDFANK